MALKGVKVIELAGLAPGPYCGMVLANFGASVIRVDRTSSSQSLDVLDNGKQSIAINLKHADGVNIVKKLCQESDVLIEPFRKGVMENLGLGPKILLNQNPRLIYARLTGYGQEGSYAPKAGHDINYLSLSGLLSRFVRNGQKPLFPANVIADFGGGGLTCAMGIVMALFEREKSGLGQVIDANMVEGTAYLGSWIYHGYKRLPLWGNPPGENPLDSGSFYYDTYETKDGKYMAVGAIEQQFYNDFMRGLGLDPKQISQSDNTDETKRLITKIFAGKTQSEWVKVFDQLEGCVTPVLSLEEAPEFEHNKERGSFQVDEDGQFVPKPAPRLSRTPGMIGKSRARYGEDTLDVLKGLGFSDGEVKRLEDEGAVKCERKTSKL